MPPVRYAIAIHPPAAVPRFLNGFAFWNVMLLVLMVIAYTYPIGQFFYLHKHDSPLSNDGTGGDAFLGRTRRDCSRGVEVIGSQDLDVGSFTISSARSFSKQVDQRHWPHPSPASLRVRASESSAFSGQSASACCASESRGRYTISKMLPLVLAAALAA